jgi:hypothetical protein
VPLGFTIIVSHPQFIHFALGFGPPTARALTVAGLGYCVVEAAVLKVVSKLSGHGMRITEHGQAE